MFEVSATRARFKREGKRKACAYFCLVAYVVLEIQDFGQTRFWISLFASIQLKLRQSENRTTDVEKMRISVWHIFKQENISGPNFAAEKLERENISPKK